MREDLIRFLATRLPDANCFNDLHFGTPKAAPVKRWPLHDRLSCCLFEPAFGYLLVRTYLLRNEFIGEVAAASCAMSRAWFHNRGHHDDLIAEMQALLAPSTHGVTATLNALLIAPDISKAEIAKVLSIREEVVEIYNDLFFNIRDREANKAYLNHLAYGGGTRLAASSKEFKAKASEAQLLLIKGYEEGAQAVLQAAGLHKQNSYDLSSDALAKELEQKLLRQANKDVSDGIINTKAVGHGVRFAQIGKQYQQHTQTTDSQMGLTAVGFHRSIADTIKRLNAPMINARKEYQRMDHEARSRKVGSTD